MNKINNHFSGNKDDLFKKFNAKFLINNNETQCTVEVFDITNGYRSELYECFFTFDSNFVQEFESLVTLGGEILYPSPHTGLNNIEKGRNVIRCLINNINEIL